MSGPPAARPTRDVVAVGSRSEESRVNSLLLGTIAHAVTRQTSLSMLLLWIEPTTEATAEICAAVCTDTLRHVLLAIDFSAHAAGAETATAVLAANAQRTIILHVMSQPILANMAHCQVMTEAALGAIAAETAASLIVFGEHGQGWPESLFIGSTALAVCETAGRRC